MRVYAELKRGDIVPRPHRAFPVKIGKGNESLGRAADYRNRERQAERYGPDD